MPSRITCASRPRVPSLSQTAVRPGSATAMPNWYTFTFSSRASTPRSRSASTTRRALSSSTSRTLTAVPDRSLCATTREWWLARADPDIPGARPTTRRRWDVDGEGVGSGGGSSGGRGRRPEVDAGLDGVPLDLGKLVVAELQLVGRGEVVVELPDAAGADEDRRHP